MKAKLYFSEINKIVTKKSIQRLIRKIDNSCFMGQSFLMTSDTSKTTFSNKNNKIQILHVCSGYSDDMIILFRAFAEITFEDINELYKWIFFINEMTSELLDEQDNGLYSYSLKLDDSTQIYDKYKENKIFVNKNNKKFKILASDYSNYSVVFNGLQYKDWSERNE